MNPAPRTRTPVIAGPTAGGKSALALALAERLAARGARAEILSADAFQVYRGLDIGTAKPSTAERARVPHHLVDLVDPAERFTVADWLALALPLLDRLRDQGVTPIVVGGTHLYVKSLLDGMFEGPPADPSLRATLESRGPAWLRAELEHVDPAAAARLHPNDLRRTIRALEVRELTGRPISSHQAQWDRPRESPFLLVGLEWPVPALSARINARVRDMIARGLVEEARTLWAAGRLGPQAREAIGYRQLIDHFEARATLDDAVERIKIDSRRLAKSQRTWLRRLRATPGSVWLGAADRSPEDLAQDVHRALGWG